MTDIIYTDGASVELLETLTSLELTLRVAQANKHPTINRLIRQRCNELMKTVERPTTRTILNGIRSQQLCSVQLEKALAALRALKNGELEVTTIPVNQQ